MTTTATHGLKGKIKEIVKQMDALRSHNKNPRNIGLREFLAEQYQLTPGHLYSELGLEQGTTVQELMADSDNAYLLAEVLRDGMMRGLGLAQREQMAAARRGLASQAPILSEGNGGARYITPEVFLDPVMRGAVQSVFYPDLVVREIMVGQPTATIPRLDLSEASIADSEEGATIEEGSVSYGSKDIRLKKQAKGIKVTYEAIKFNTLDLVALFFEDFGRLLGSRLNGEAVLAITNGDQSDGSEAAAVIGVDDTAKGVQYIDVLRVWIRLSLLGRRSTSVIGNESTAIDFLNLPEVRDKQFSGSALLPTSVKTPLPTDQDLYVSTKVAASQLVFQDSSASLVQLTAWPLMLEIEKIVSKQIEGTFASIYTGFAKLQRNASVTVDGGITFAANGFPSWMNPFAD
jgi:HK97 family phage major capsid protein